MILKNLIKETSSNTVAELLKITTQSQEGAGLDVVTELY